MITVPSDEEQWELLGRAHRLFVRVQDAIDNNVDEAAVRDLIQGEVTGLTEQVVNVYRFVADVNRYRHPLVAGLLERTIRPWLPQGRCWLVTWYAFCVENDLEGVSPLYHEGGESNSKAREHLPKLHRETLRGVLVSNCGWLRAQAVAAMDLLARYSEWSAGIAALRKTWTTMPDADRDAIACACQRRGLVEVLLSVLMSGPGSPYVARARRRWVDELFENLRLTLWNAVDRACAEFALEASKLGDEHQQIGSLLQRVFGQMLHQTSELEACLPCSEDLVGRLEVDRYIFHTAEEHRWGPDFAWIVRIAHCGRLSLARYLLFQAKLIKGGRINVPISQLQCLLATAWHSSVYVCWDETMQPQCVGASLLRDHDHIRRSVLLGTAEPSVAWRDIAQYADSLADLVGDRFFCGELGDPLELPVETNCRDLALHLGSKFGCREIAVFTLSVGKTRDGRIVRISPDPQVIYPRRLGAGADEAQ